MAHPTFDDPLFEPLRLLGQDYIVPNIANLPAESIALMVPNVRSSSRCWRGSTRVRARAAVERVPDRPAWHVLRTLFDAADAGAERPPDIVDVHEWDTDLGQNSPSLSGLLVLVVRAELLVKFPDTLVFAQARRLQRFGCGTAPHARHGRRGPVPGGARPTPTPTSRCTGST